MHLDSNSPPVWVGSESISTTLKADLLSENKILTGAGVREAGGTLKSNRRSRVNSRSGADLELLLQSILSLTLHELETLYPGETRRVPEAPRE